jgi:alpha-galactosidase
MRNEILLDKTVPRVRSIIGKNPAFMMLVSGLFLSAHAVKAPCLTPAMGWNSYNCYSYSVTQSEFMANARYVADNLKPYGWQYCVVDFVWWIPNNGIYGNNQSGNWNVGHIDQYGRFLPDTIRFPSSKGGRGFKPLADSVHNLGLKFGIHTMRGVPRMAVRNNSPIFNSTYTCSQAADQNSTCPWLDWMYGANMNSPAGQAYLNSILSLYDSWDVDFIKVDDLSAATYHTAEVAGYANAIASVGREIAFSTSPGPTPINQASHVMQYANQWRLVNDLWDEWGQLVNAHSVSEKWRNTLVNGNVIAGPGHWPDVDMLPFGRLALRGPVGSPRYSLSTFTKGEHKLMYFLWCVNNNPLMWGGNLPDNNNNLFYDSLMKCGDALFINQNGTRGRVVKGYSPDSTSVWVSVHPTDTNTKFVGFFNMKGSQANMSVTLSAIGIAGSVPVKEVWSGRSLGTFTSTLSQTVTAHNAELYIVGSGSTSLAPAQSHPEKGVQPDVEKVFYSPSSRLIVPACFSGKTVRVSAFSLGGKLLNSTVTRERSIQLDRINSRGCQVRIVKIAKIR